MILRDAYVSINGVDFTDECREVNVEDARADHDNTVMRMTAESVEAGLGRWTITVKLRQNYATGRVHQTIRPLLGTICTVVVRPDATRGPAADNEQITGLGMLLTYQPISGAAGQPSEPSLEFRNAGTMLSYAVTLAAEDEDPDAFTRRAEDAHREELRRAERQPERPSAPEWQRR